MRVTRRAMENRLQEIVKRKDDVGILEFDYNAFAE
jgi:hypothetical protein